MSVTRGSADGQGGASGSEELRDAASRNAALPKSALSSALPIARHLAEELREHLQKHFSVMFRAITRAR